MYACSTEKFEQILSRFRENFTDTAILEYFERNWLPRKETWALAYRNFPHADIDTNNFVEAWHRQLKYRFSGHRKQNRMDSLIYLLVKVVLPEYEIQDRAANFNIGRMNPQRRLEVERENVATAIPLADSLQMVSPFDDITNSFQVK